MLFEEFCTQLFYQGERVVGRAVFAAKCSVIARYPTQDYYYGPAVLWTLFGDPALRVKHRLQTGVAEDHAPSPGDVRVPPFGLRHSSFVTSPVPLAPGEECYDALGRRALPVRPGVYVIRRCGRLSGKLIITR